MPVVISTACHPTQPVTSRIASSTPAADATPPTRMLGVSTGGGGPAGVHGDSVSGAGAPHPARSAATARSKVDSLRAGFGMVSSLAGQASMPSAA